MSIVRPTVEGFDPQRGAPPSRSTCLVRDPKPLENAGHPVENRMVLLHLGFGSGADACVSRVHVERIVAGARHHALNTIISNHPPSYLQEP